MGTSLSIMTLLEFSDNTRMNALWFKNLLLNVKETTGNRLKYNIQAFSADQHTINAQQIQPTATEQEKQYDQLVNILSLL